MIPPSTPSASTWPVRVAAVVLAAVGLLPMANLVTVVLAWVNRPFTRSVVGLLVPATRRDHCGHSGAAGAAGSDVGAAVARRFTASNGSFLSAFAAVMIAATACFRLPPYFASTVSNASRSVR
jgi:hypothetical protein